MSRTAIIFCGGEGKRFTSISSKPKILTEFNGRTFFDWMIEYIERHGFSRVSLCLGYKSELVIAHLEGVKTKLKIDYIVEKTPLGTGGALQLYLKSSPQKEIYVFNGDTYFSEDLPEELFSEELKGRFVLLTAEVKSNDRYDDLKESNGALLIRRGTSKNIIENSSIFCGVARCPVVRFEEKLKTPFSFAKLMSVQEPKFTLIDFKGDVIDFGVPTDYYRLKEALHP